MRHRIFILLLMIYVLIMQIIILDSDKELPSIFTSMFYVGMFLIIAMTIIENICEEKE